MGRTRRADSQAPKLTRNYAEKEQRIQDALAGIKGGKYKSFRAAARDLQVMICLPKNVL